MSAARDPTSRDQPPVPPEKPLASDCCDGGCDRCVFDLYAEELEQYESRLKHWRANHPDRAGQEMG